MGLNNELIDRDVINKFKGAKGSKITTSFFYLMKELHISYFELMEMPIPSIFILLEELKEHNIKEEKAMKKKR